MSLPWFPGAFGERAYTMMPHLEQGATAKSLRGFNSGTDTLQWFYADELLYSLMLNEPLLKHCRAPLTDLYECCEHFFIQSGVVSILAKFLTWTMVFISPLRRSGVRQDEAAWLVRIAETLQAQ